MAKTLYIQDLLRLTLTRKGQAIAKHPFLREGVVEAIKAEPVEPETLWEHPKDDERPSRDASVAARDDDDWYSRFEAYIASIPEEDIPDDWVEGFNASQFGTEYTEKAKSKNYPDAEGPFAGPHNSFPITSQAKVFSAARLLGHAAASTQASIKQRIISIAHSHGWRLPKSWTSKKSGELDDIMDNTQFEALLQRVSEKLEALTHKAEPVVEVPVETPAEPVTETPAAAPAETDAEKAAANAHYHEHGHASLRGYGYSHSHQHGHDDMSHHEDSDSAHAHEHVGKADSLPEDVQADLAGLDADLKARTEERDALKAELEALQAKYADVAKTAEQVEAVKAELKLAVEEARKPLIEKSALDTTEKAKPNVKGKSFDDAFHALMHS